MGARFSAPVQTGPGAHPVSYTVGTESFLGVKSGRGVTLTPHPFLVPWSWKSIAIPLLPLCVVRPVQSLSVCIRVTFTFTFFYLHIFLIMSCWILLRMGNATDKICRANQKTHFIFNTLSSENSVVYAILWKVWWRQRGYRWQHNSFIHLVVCLTTGPKPLPKRALHIVRSRASSFKWEYPLLSLRSYSIFLRLLPRLPVTSNIILRRKGAIYLDDLGKNTGTNSQYIILNTIPRLQCVPERAS